MPWPVMKQKSIEAGMNDHVTKPIDPDKLFATLQKWIKPVAERAAVQKPPILDAIPESGQAVLDEDELPVSLPGFDLAAGLARLMGNKCFTANCCLILGQTMAASPAKSVRHWQPGILSRPTAWSIILKDWPEIWKPQTFRLRQWKWKSLLKEIRRKRSPISNWIRN